MSQKRPGGRGGSKNNSGRPSSSGRGSGRPSTGRSGSGRPSSSGGTGASRGYGSKGRRPTGDGDNRRDKTESGLGGTQVEGRQAVRELLLAGRRRCREIFLSSEVERSGIIEDIVDLAREMRVTVNEVSRSKLDSMSRTDAPQGVVAHAAPIKEVTLEDLLDSEEAPFLLAVDGVTDPGNLGALLRIADCAGVTGVILPRHRAVHITPTVTKAAAGAVEYLPMALVGGLATAIADLKKAEVWTVGLDMAGSESIHELRVATESVCLVLGAEGKGLSRLVRERCDFVASIPIYGHLDSLNVASAGAVAAYEVARLRSAVGD
ncbi:MAG: 23S rRNA (guanosine(2251)-2'-O)-methyltransferase RlmB [Microthrixaceae bacterium]|nr:23S rRNA (guanosine(2251)-2'-O)-methyltransferase RlmB [Microthrixaceae bacterium]